MVTQSLSSGTGCKSLNQLHTGFFPQGKTYTDGQKPGQDSKRASLKDAGVLQGGGESRIHKSYYVAFLSKAKSNK